MTRKERYNRDSVIEILLYYVSHTVLKLGRIDIHNWNISLYASYWLVSIFLIHSNLANSKSRGTNLKIRTKIKVLEFYFFEKSEEKYGKILKRLKKIRKFY